MRQERDSYTVEWRGRVEDGYSRGNPHVIPKGIPHPKHRAKKQAQGLKKAEAYEAAEMPTPITYLAVLSLEN